MCYSWHSPDTGDMYMVNRRGLVKCLDDHTFNMYVHIWNSNLITLCLFVSGKILWMISMIQTEEEMIDMTNTTLRTGHRIYCFINESFSQQLITMKMECMTIKIVLYSNIFKPN